MRGHCRNSLQVFAILSFALTLCSFSALAQTETRIGVRNVKTVIFQIHDQKIFFSDNLWLSGKWKEYPKQLPNGLIPVSLSNRVEDLGCGYAACAYRVYLVAKANDGKTYERETTFGNASSIGQREWYLSASPTEDAATTITTTTSATTTTVR